MPPFAAIGLPSCIKTALHEPVVTGWMTLADIPDTVAGLFEELTAPRWLPPSALDVAELLPTPEVDPEDVRSLWPEQPSWHVDAACRSMDPAKTDELFYGFDDGRHPALPPESMDQAREICAVCPSRVSCLLWALEHDERFGIWAGTTGRQRANFKVALRERRVTMRKLLSIYG